MRNDDVIYRIKNWEVFEHPTENRRPKKGMDWHAHPTSLSSKGRLRLLRLGDPGFRALVVFESIIQLLSQRPIELRDGSISNSDGTPIEMIDLADALNISETIIRKSLQVLSTKEIGWIEVENLTNPDKTCHDSTKVVSTGQDITGQDKTGQSMSVSADANATSSAKDPDSLPEIADWCARAWARCKEAKGLTHWSDARTPTKNRNLSARRKEFATLDQFRAGFVDRLIRMSAAYAAPIGENKWCPDLPWLLAPNGWEKAAAKPTPEQIATAPRAARPNERFTENDPLLRGLSDAERQSYLGSSGGSARSVPIDVHASVSGNASNLVEDAGAHSRRLLGTSNDGDGVSGGEVPINGADLPICATVHREDSGRTETA